LKGRLCALAAGLASVVPGWRRSFVRCAVVILSPAKLRKRGVLHRLRQGLQPICIVIAARRVSFTPLPSRQTTKGTIRSSCSPWVRWDDDGFNHIIKLLDLADTVLTVSLRCCVPDNRLFISSPACNVNQHYCQYECAANQKLQHHPNKNGSFVKPFGSSRSELITR